MIFIAIGSNLGPPAGGTPLDACRTAVHALAALEGVTLVRVSPWYVTAPMPRSDQPDFVNGVALLSGQSSPGVLLAKLQEIEQQAGRVRIYGQPNAARVLDLDIVDMDGLVRASPDPVLPHPRAYERGFVLFPLADLAPDWMHPGLKVPIARLIRDLPPQQVCRLNENEGIVSPQRR